MKLLRIKVPCILGDLILRLLDCTVTISFRDCFNLFCNVWVLYVWVLYCVGFVCVGFVLCGCFGNMYSPTCIYCVLYFFYCVVCIV